MAARRAKNYRCTKCDAAFESNRNLQRHLARKTPCNPIIDIGPTPTGGESKPHRCRYCGRGYSRSDSLARHLARCNIANSEEGMSKLIEHTLRRQLAEQQELLRQQLAEQSAKIDRLTFLLEQQVAKPPAEGAAPIGSGLAFGQVSVGAAPGAVSVLNAAHQGPIGQQVNTQTTVNASIVINPWDSDRRLLVDLSHIVAAFSENARLKEYTRYSDHELADPAVGTPYVAELLVDLVRRGHADPAARNVYLNPRRSDQVLVHLKSGRWEVMAFTEASGLLLDGVARSIHKVALSYSEMRELPLEAQSALAIAGMLYDEEPSAYISRTRSQMAAHLTNMAPRRGADA